MVMKRSCTFCGAMKPLTEFGLRPDGKPKAQCRACKNDESRAAYYKNPKLVHARNLAWQKRDRLEHPEKYQAKYREKADRMREANRLWYARNREAQRQRGLRRYKATRGPPWLSAIQLAQIQEFYDIAQARTIQTGIEHHVDHVHPLEGVNFCGLHVPWNLQVLTNIQNARKGKKILDMRG